MSKQFKDCVKNGGKTIRLKPRSDTYLNVCYPKDGGRAVSGETHKMQQEAEDEITNILNEESSTANTVAAPTAAMSKVMRKVMPKGKELPAEEKKKMKKKMKKANAKGMMVSENEETN